ncbi:MAG: signal peptidase I [Clostridia bacterium]|nr:signal peptidase I [Clostridia bacterium]
MVKNKKISSIYEWIGCITAALLAITLLFTFCFRLVNVDGTSMVSTLQHGERLILSRFPYTPARGDIVVISQGEDREPLIKRVIGLAGDTIRIEKETGDVFLNGKKLIENYVHTPTATEKMKEEVTVPENHVFVMGDNRGAGHSLDSRTFGCIEESLLVGKAVFRLFPLNRAGGLYDES